MTTKKLKESVSLADNASMMDRETQQLFKLIGGYNGTREYQISVYGYKPPHSINVSQTDGFGNELPAVQNMEEDPEGNFIRDEDDLEKMVEYMATQGVRGEIDYESGAIVILDMPKAPDYDEEEGRYETKVNRVYTDNDSWRATILDCEGEDKPKIIKDADNNQDVAMKGESVIGVFDHDIQIGMIIEDGAGKDYANQEDWLKDMGTGITIDQGEDTDPDAPVVAKDAEGNVVGTYTTVDGKGQGVKISESGKEMVKSGLVVTYSGGTRKNWCK